MGKAKEDKKHDKAVDMTFPASDPRRALTPAYQRRAEVLSVGQRVWMRQRPHQGRHSARGVAKAGVYTIGQIIPSRRLSIGEVRRVAGGQP